MRPLRLIILCLLFLFATAQEHYDVVIYGGTAAGCVAALAASRTGASSVLLAAPEKNLGGMTTGGIMHADAANTSTIGGITREFFDLVVASYHDDDDLVVSDQRRHLSKRQQQAVPVPHPGSPSQIGPVWLYESHVAEQVLEDMLAADANITVMKDLVGIDTVKKNGTVVRSITTTSGLSLSGFTWIDASYEGDLAFFAGADMVWGREAVTKYNETGAGRQPETLAFHIDPFWPDGSVIPHISEEPMVPLGEADSRIQPYAFRLCITNSPSNRVPFTRPANYNASEFELWRRLYKNGSHPPSSLGGAGLSCLGPIPNSYNDCGHVPCVKCDMLGMVHSTDLYNEARGYPNGTLAERAAIRQSHVDYTLSLLWFWASDPASGTTLHQEMSSLGFCKDEYVDSDPPHFPYQLYVREARRLVGDFVWTEHEPSTSLLRRSVGVGAYSFDCHWVSLYVSRSGNSVAAEGRVNRNHEGKQSNTVFQRPFRMPYDVLLPKRTQLTNVLVPVACSASHVRFNAVRMEPAWMILGQAAGVAAALTTAAKATRSVQDIDVSVLQDELLKQSQIIWE